MGSIRLVSFSIGALCSAQQCQQCSRVVECSVGQRIQGGLNCLVPALAMQGAPAMTTCNAAVTHITVEYRGVLCCSAVENAPNGQQLYPCDYLSLRYMCVSISRQSPLHTACKLGCRAVAWAELSERQLINLMLGLEFCSGLQLQSCS